MIASKSPAAHATGCRAAGLQSDISCSINLINQKKTHQLGDSSIPTIIVGDVGTRHPYGMWFLPGPLSLRALHRGSFLTSYWKIKSFCFCFKVLGRRGICIRSSWLLWPLRRDDGAGLGRSIVKLITTCAIIV